MSTLLFDLKFGFRMLAKSPVVSGIAALSLALGIAAATAMFALASAFWLEPLPFGDQDGLILVRELRHGEPVDMAANAAVGNFKDWREAATTVSAMAAMDINGENVTGVDMPEEILVAVGSPNLFDVLQIQPVQGRAFRPEEGAAVDGGVVVITDQYWERRFTRDPEILGRTLTLDGVPHTVIGVMPEGFEMLPAGVQAFRPTDLAGMDSRGSKGWLVFGRLRPGTTVDQARAELTAVQARLETEYPEANRGWGLLVQNARKWFPGPTDAKLIFLLMAVSLFGVAIACANVANLLLSRAETRMKEVAVRSALGAGKARILRQLLTESVLLGLAGGGLGTVFSVYVIRGLSAAMPAELPQAFRPTLDVPTLLATVGVAVLAGVLFGLAPALHATRGNLKEALGEGSRGGTASRTRKRLRNIFVVGQLAVALALLTGAGELREAMNSLVFADNGFNAENVLTFQISLPDYRYPETADIRRFQEELIRELQEIPGAVQVGLLSGLPRGRSIPNSFYSVEGQEYEDPNERPRTNWDAVSPSFFETLDIPMATGRNLSDMDREDTRLVAVVNQELARRAFPDQDPIGKRVILQGEPREIVGVVQNFMQRRIPFDGFVEPAIFLPAAQLPRRNAAFVVRTGAEPTALAADVRNAVWSVDPDQPVAQVQTLEEFIQVELAAPAFLGLFVGGLAALAMFLSGIGIYGVMAHTVLQERRELGIRLAIGARGGQLVGMVTRRGLVLSAVGITLGTPLAILIHRAVVSALSLFDADFGLGITLVAGGTLAGVAILASYIPARGAARVQPTRALVEE
ncbi:MAG: ABC transporter permease [Longimicrobiales bacterium]